MLCPLFSRLGGGGCERLGGRGRSGHTLGCLPPSPGRAEFPRSWLVSVRGGRLGKRENVYVCARPGSRARWRIGAGRRQGRRRRPRMEVGVEESDVWRSLIPVAGKRGVVVELAGAMPGEKARWKSAHLGCVGRPGREVREA